MAPAAAAACALIVAWAAPAYAADKTIMASGLPSCPAGQIATAVTLKLNNVGSDQQITVRTTVSAITKSPDSLVNGLTYNVALDGRYQNASAIVYSTWSGTFQLTNTTCQDARSASVTVSSSPQGVTPITLIARVSNPNDIMVTYQVSIPGHVVQKTSVLAHQTGQVGFQPAACGTSYTVSASGDDGTNSSGTGTTVDCQSTPTSPGTMPTQATVSPTPSASRSASASASAKPSASPSISESWVDPFTTQGTSTDTPDVIPAPSNKAGGKHDTTVFTLTNMVMGGGTLLTLAGVLAIITLIRKARRARTDDLDED